MIEYTGKVKASRPVSRYFIADKLALLSKGCRGPCTIFAHAVDMSLCEKKGNYSDCAFCLQTITWTILAETPNEML